MKTLLPFLTLICFISSGSAQSYERTDDRGFNTTVERVHVMGDGSWVSLIRYSGFGFSSYSGGSIQYFSENGALQWEEENLNMPYLVAKELLKTNDGNIAFFSSISGCDVAQGLPMRAGLLNSNGDVLVENILSLDVDAFNSELKGCVTDSTVFIASGHYGEPYLFPSQVNGLNSSLDSLWTLYLSFENIDHIASQGQLAVIFAEDKLLRIDGGGNKIDSLEISETPFHVTSTVNDELLLSMSDGVYELDNMLNLVQVLTYPEPSEPQHIMYAADQIHLVYSDAIYVYNNLYDFIESFAFLSLPDFVVRDCALSEEAYVLVGSRPFVTTIRHMWGIDDFETSSGAMYIVPLENETPEQFPDAALRHLELTNYDPTDHQADASFYLINEGDVQLDSVQVNFMANVNPITCGYMGNTQNFTELSLSPGDSVELFMEGLTYGYPFNYLPEDSAGVEFCVYVTQPNRQYDRVADNDEVCGVVDLGVSIEEFSSGINNIYPNPAQEMVTIEFSETAESVAVQVYDASGKQIEEISVNQQSQMTINVADWNNGLYYFRMISGDSTSQPVKVSIVH